MLSSTVISKPQNLPTPATGLTVIVKSHVTG